MGNHRRVGFGGADRDRNVKALFERIHPPIRCDEFDLNLRIVLGERGGDGCDNRLSQELRCRYAQDPARRRPQIPDRSVGLLDLGEDSGASLVVRRAGVGRAKDPRGALEQANAQRRLQPGNALAYRGFGKSKRLGGGGEMSRPSDRDERGHCIKTTAAQALVEVHAISLTFGELGFLEQMHKPGDVPGWDAAGVVVRAAADGSGPRPGARVTTAGWNGAWAELRAVDTSELADLPVDMDFGAASALPVAGVTALRAIRSLGSVVGRRVLVTGASGGVGGFAVQLARRAGAHVVASVSGEGRGEGLHKLGAREVVVGLDAVSEPFHGVLDHVGALE